MPEMPPSSDTPLRNAQVIEQELEDEPGLTSNETPAPPAEPEQPNQPMADDPMLDLMFKRMLKAIATPLHEKESARDRDWGDEYPLGENGNAGVPVTIATKPAPAALELSAPLESTVRSSQLAARKAAGKSIVYNAQDLFQLANDKSVWLIDNLIREGNQVMLSGPPKSGKTILALQLALDIAGHASHFLLPAHTIPSKRTVLVVSFEMRQKAMAARLFLQAPRRELENLHFVFRSEMLQGSLFGFDSDTEEVYPMDACRRLKQIIREIKPDLIIIDSLVQLHSLDENNNLKMSGLMRGLRKLCSTLVCSTEEAYNADLSGDIEKHVTPENKKKNLPATVRYWERKPIAHVIIHHTRKPPDNMKVYASPEAIRGASAIHSEADLALTLSVPWTGGISLNKSSRELRAEKSTYHVIKEEGGRVHIAPAPPRDLKKTEVLARLYKTLSSGETYSVTDIHKALLDSKLLTHVTNSTEIAAFKSAFYKRLEPLNDYQSKRGPGAKTCIKLAEDTSWEDFATLLLRNNPPELELGEFTPLPVAVLDGDAPDTAEKSAESPESAKSKDSQQTDRKQIKDESPATPVSVASAPAAKAKPVGGKKRGRPPGKNKKRAHK